MLSINGWMNEWMVERAGGWGRDAGFDPSGNEVGMKREEGERNVEQRDIKVAEFFPVVDTCAPEVFPSSLWTEDEKWIQWITLPRNSVKFAAKWTEKKYKN